MTQVVLRHGLERASVADVAAELWISRMTVYRQAGNVDQMIRLLISREIHLRRWTVTYRPRSAAAERVLALPHHVDVEAGLTWSYTGKKGAA